MAENNCTPPVDLNEDGTETNPDVLLEDVTPPDDQPPQDDLEDWNFNYVNNDQDPTNSLDADGNILSNPLEIWEITSPTTVTIPGEGKTAPTGRKSPRTYTTFENDVQLNYYPYGNNQIAAGTPVLAEDRSQVIGGETYFYSLQDAITGIEVQGYAMLNVRKNSTTAADATWLGFADMTTGDLVAVWNYQVSPALGAVFPERHPWFGYGANRTESNIDLGTLNEDPFSSGKIAGPRTNSPYQDWVLGNTDFDVTNKFSGIYPSGYIGLPIFRYWAESDITGGIKRIAWVEAQDYFSESPGYTGASYDERNEAGWEYFDRFKIGFSERSNPYRDTVFWIDIPADVTTGGTIDVNFFYPDRRKLERWMYDNHGMPLGLLDRHGYQKEYRDRAIAAGDTSISGSRNPQPTGGFWHGVQSIDRTGWNTTSRCQADKNTGNGTLLQGRVVFSPSGNRMATTLAVDGFPAFYWYETQPSASGPNPLRKTTPNIPAGLIKNGSKTSIIVIYDLVAGEWEISNVVTDPLFYGSDFGAIEDDGSIRTYTGSATPDLREPTHPTIEFTDENTIKAKYFSQQYWDNAYNSLTDTFYIEEYDFNVTSGVGDFAPNGPAVLSSSKTATTSALENVVDFDPFTHPVASEYRDLEEQNPGLLLNITRALKQPILYQIGDAPLGSMIRNVEAEYNGFKLISFPDAPLVPNLSMIHGGGNVPFDIANVNNSVYGKALRMRYEYTHRRGFAGVGEVIAVDGNGDIVYRFEPEDAREWVKFQKGANGGRIIGRPLLYSTTVVMPEDEVSSTHKTLSGNVVGTFLHFGQQMHVQGTNLWVSQNWYKGNEDSSLVDPSVYNPKYAGTPASSDKLWEKSGWVKIDLSAIPELNP